jgi:hypothetical protein
LNDVNHVDIAFDGADEVDASMNLIKVSLTPLYLWKRMVALACISSPCWLSDSFQQFLVLGPNCQNRLERSVVKSCHHKTAPSIWLVVGLLFFTLDCCLYFSFSLSAVGQGGGAAHTMEKVHPPLMLFHLSSRASVVSSSGMG